MIMKKKILFPIEIGMNKLNQQLKTSYKKEQDIFDHVTKEERDRMEDRKLMDRIAYLNDRIRFIGIETTNQDPQFETDIPKDYVSQAIELLGEAEMIEVTSKGFSIMKDKGKIVYTDNEMIDNITKIKDTVECFKKVKAKLHDPLLDTRLIESTAQTFDQIESELTKCEKPHFELVNKIKEFFELPNVKQKELID